MTDLRRRGPAIAIVVVWAVALAGLAAVAYILREGTDTVGWIITGLGIAFILCTAIAATSDISRRR
jgi:hypothetical protein